MKKIVVEKQDDHLKEYNIFTDDIEKYSKDEGKDDNIFVTKEINVLLVGKTQSGKSSLIKMFLNSTFSKPMKFYSQTKSPYIVSITVIKNNEKYMINFIDTPGLMEHTIKEDEKRTNKILFDIISKFLFTEIRKLHCVFFVHKAGNMTEEDLECFDLLMKYFGNEFAENCALIITNADLLSDEERKYHIDQILNDSNLKEFRSYLKKGIYFSQNLTYKYKDKYDVQKDDILKDKNEIINLIIECQNKYIDIYEINEIMKILKNKSNDQREALRQDFVELKKKNNSCNIQ